jgi:hypothetical protein
VKKRRRRKRVTYDGRMRHYNGNRSGMRTVLPIAVLMIDASFSAIAGAATRVTRDESVFTPSRIFFCSPSVRATLGSDTKRARARACVGWAASERVGAEARLEEAAIRADVDAQDLDLAVPRDHVVHVPREHLVHFISSGSRYCRAPARVYRLLPPEYPRVHRGTREYRRVPGRNPWEYRGSIRKLPEVTGSTLKYSGCIREYLGVPGGTWGYPWGTVGVGSSKLGVRVVGRSTKRVRRGAHHPDHVGAELEHEVPPAGAAHTHAHTRTHARTRTHKGTHTRNT